MDEEEMEDVGIETYEPRKRLLKAIRNATNGQTARTQDRGHIHSNATTSQSEEDDVLDEAKNYRASLKEDKATSNPPSCSAVSTLLILGFGGEIKDVKILCPKGHIMVLYGSQGDQYKCAGGCGGMNKTEDDESMICSSGCALYLSGLCSEKKKA